MCRALGSIAFALLLPVPAMAADETAAMRAAADGFYRVYSALHVSGVPGGADLAKFSSVLSPRLELLLQQAAAAEDRFHTANKSAPPLAEGDLFTSLFEGATGYTIGTCSVGAQGASCAANLTYSDPANKQSWTDTVHLVTTPAGWRVDDIGYGGSWAFGNKGRLSDTLRQVAAFP